MCIFCHLYLKTINKTVLRGHLNNKLYVTQYKPNCSIKASEFFKGILISKFYHKDIGIHSTGKAWVSISLKWGDVLVSLSPDLNDSRIEISFIVPQWENSVITSAN